MLEKVARLLKKTKQVAGYAKCRTRCSLPARGGGAAARTAMPAGGPANPTALGTPNADYNLRYCQLYRK